MKKTVIFLFLILCMTAVNTGCQKKQETDFILENPKEHICLWSSAKTGSL